MQLAVQNGLRLSCEAEDIANLTKIVVAGRSAGGQFVARYAMAQGSTRRVTV